MDNPPEAAVEFANFDEDGNTNNERTVSRANKFIAELSHYAHALDS